MSVFKKLRGTTSDRFTIGIGQNGSKYLEADIGSTNSPFIRFDSSSNRWEFSHNGIDIYPLYISIFGDWYAAAVSESVSTTTSTSYVDKVSLIASLKGVSRVEYYCELACGSANRRVFCRLYDATHDVELCTDYIRPAVTLTYNASYGVALLRYDEEVRLVVQYSSPDGVTAYIRRARIAVWRVE